MNFELSSERQLLADSVQRLVSDKYDLEQRQKYVGMKGGFDAEIWQSMAELGWLALPVPEAQGGFGGNQIDTMLLMESFGRGLVVEPYLANVVLGARLLRESAAQSDLLASVLTGERHVTLGYAEVQSRFDLHDVRVEARAEAGAFVLTGKKTMVQNLGTSDHVIVSARTSGSPLSADGISLFLVPVDAEGAKVTSFPTVDGLQSGEFDLDEVRVDESALIGPLNDGFALLQAAIVDGILAVSAEAVGAMEVLYKDTVAYIQEREQFDQPLSEFQVLRHRMVDMFVEYEQAKSLLYRATLEVAERGLEAIRTVHALKHFIGKTGVMIGEQAVQTHGGMGMTEELRIGHYFKRLLVIEAQFGNSDHHLQEFAELKVA